MRRRTKYRMAVPLWALLAAVPGQAAEPRTALSVEQHGGFGLARAMDGDTIEVAGEAIMLYGIDAPEPKQTCTWDGAPWRCGEAATAALSRIVDGRQVHCDRETVTSIGRSVATCRLTDSNLDIAAEMVRQGYAFASRYTYRYVPLEIEARAEKAGLWAVEFQAPWKWRDDHRPRAK